ncbi:TRAM domain-containing protein [Leptolyngbya sp. SLC-A1]|nr:MULTISPECIES: TRAM domain-containing protein [Cyanophyceae]
MRDFAALKGELVQVKITEVRPFSLTGEPIQALVAAG